jgi:hypothetical protein
MPTKRQIIRTRPQRPYVIARIILLLLVVIALGLAVWLLGHPHPAHAFMLLQEAHLADRMAHIHPSMERRCS